MRTTSQKKTHSIKTLTTSCSHLLGDGISGTTFFHSFGSSGIGLAGNRKQMSTHERLRVVQSVFFAEFGWVDAEILQKVHL